ncbi:MAG: hypothetical protein ABIF12_03570 [bacterium]
MRNYKILFVGFLFFIGIANASLDITIHNEALENLFVATYYVKNKKAERVSDVKEVLAEDQIKFKKPKFKVTYDRKLFFSYKKDALVENLEGLKFENMPKMSIGAKHGNSFYIAPEGSTLVGYKFLRWNLIEKTKDFLNKYFSSVSSFYSKMKPKDIRNAKVRISKDLCEQEFNYLAKRRPIAKAAIESFTGIKLDQDNVPTIAVCASGGGYRAMQAALGLFSGAEKINFLDCITYAAGLSGSTWFITPWLYFEESVANYKKRLKPKVAVDLGKKEVLKKGKIDIKLDFPLRPFICYAVLKSKMFGQKMTSVDIYGSLLADKLFSDIKRSNRQKIKLSDLVSRIENGKKPFPILTAVQPGPPFSWYEFTPYEIGPSLKNSFIPTWAFGRKFLSGKSKDNSFEQSLGFFMGIWGSAYTANLKIILDEMQDSLPKEIYNWLDSSLEIIGGTEKRVSPAILNNFNYGLKGVGFKNMQSSTLIDAGLHFNLPFPPLLRPERNIDIIIVCDASARAHEGAHAVRDAEKWAAEKGLKFPKIDYNVIGKETFSIFKDDNDPTVPTIIYFSLVKNDKFNSNFDPVKEIKDGFCGTFNFVYKPEQFELLTGLMEYNVINAKDAVKTAIINKIEQKKMMKEKITEEVNKAAALVK